MSLQNTHQSVGDLDCTPAGFGLGLLLDNGADTPLMDQPFLNLQSTLFKVNTGPFQSKCFALSQTGVEDGADIKTNIK